MPSPLAKRFAGKVTGACGHTVPVLVPCLDCVERQLDGMEQRIRDECNRSLTDDMKRAKEESAQWKSRMEKAESKYADQERIIATLKSDKAILMAHANSLQKQVAEMKVQLHAAQVVPV